MQDQSEGKKFDGGKPRYSLLPEGTVAQVVQVLEYGARKYNPDNWKKVPDARRRYYDAAMRHLDAWWRGAVNDQETGMPHLAHASCCLMFLMWLDENAQAKVEAPKEEPKRGVWEAIQSTQGVQNEIKRQEETMRELHCKYFGHGQEFR